MKNTEWIELCQVAQFGDVVVGCGASQNNILIRYPLFELNCTSIELN